MGLLTIYRADTGAELASESRSTDPTATWVSGSFVGYKTWNCANKVMPQNLVIGGKTLNCANDMMPYNVTAYYRHVWTKYNCVATYTDTRYSFGPVSPGGYYIHETGSYGDKYVARTGNNYTFDTSTGKYTLAGGTISLIPSSLTTGWYLANTTESSYKYGAGPPKSDNTNSWDKLYEGGSLVYWQVFSSNIRAVNDYEEYSGSAYYHTATANYSRGSTSYGNVESTSDSTYPSNGRHTDGYWYVKIY